MSSRNTALRFRTDFEGLTAKDASFWDNMLDDLRQEEELHAYFTEHFDANETEIPAQFLLVFEGLKVCYNQRHMAKNKSLLWA